MPLIAHPHRITMAARVSESFCVYAYTASGYCMGPPNMTKEKKHEPPYYRKVIRFARNIIKNTVQRFRYKKGGSTPVFLNGCGRSGTNFIVGRLNNVIEVDLYNENNPKAFNDWRLRDFGVIKNLILSSYAPIILFKPINDTYRMAKLLEEFTGSKIIFQFRHYDDVVNSIVRGPFGERKSLVKYWIETDYKEFKLFPPGEQTKNIIKQLYSDNLNDESGSALYWYLQNRFIVDQELLDNPNVILIPYEKLVCDPENTFQHLCNFLGIKYRTRMLRGLKTSSIRKNKSPDINAPILAACEKLWAILLAKSETQERYLS